MSCSINRYKFTGLANTKSDAANTAAAKEMEARMKEMLEVRAAQDGGNFKVRPSWTAGPAGPGAAIQPSAASHVGAPQ